MTFEIAIHRMRIGMHYSRNFKTKGLNYLSLFETLILLSLLLLKCGDIETNPGPDLDGSSSLNATTTQIELDIQKKFSVVHYNIQSLANKKDILESELRHFDVISLTETWLDQRTHDSDIEFVVILHIGEIAKAIVMMAYVSL